MRSKVLLYIPDSKELYRTFLSVRPDIERELGIAEPLEWQELAGKKASRIRTLKEFRFADSTTWEPAIRWLIETTIRFERVFAKNWRGRGSQQPAGGDGVTAAPQP